MTTTCLCENNLIWPASNQEYTCLNIKPNTKRSQEGEKDSAFDTIEESQWKLILVKSTYIKTNRLVVLLLECLYQKKAAGIIIYLERYNRKCKKEWDRKKKEEEGKNDSCDKIYIRYKKNHLANDVRRRRPILYTPSSYLIALRLFYLFLSMRKQAFNLDY